MDRFLSSHLAFFLEQLVNEAKQEEDNVGQEEENVPEFEHTSKVKLQDIIDELPEIIHKEFDYYDYSEKDKSNERFMTKQKNTNQLKENIFVENNDDKNLNNEKKSELELFDNPAF